jgi:hypothetical protein
MPSEKQIAANRENAKKSTGPRTPQGKSQTRLNAKRDGITGQIVTLAPEDLAIFDQLKAGMIAEFNPQTLCERQIASAIAWDTWRLNHLRAVEMNIYALGAQTSASTIECDTPELHAALADAATYERESKKFALMSIYEQRLNRSIHKNMAALKELQAEREAKRKTDLTKEVTIARAKEVDGETYQAPKRLSENGFVFSTAEVIAEANRESVMTNSNIKAFMLKDRIQYDGAWENYNPNPAPSGPKTGLKLAAAA